MTPFQLAKLNIEKRMMDACKNAHRDPQSVRLLAASKRTDAEGVINAISDGHLLFGENRAQSLRDKYAIVHPKYPQAEWHFIGHLQKNKIKYIAGKISMLHSLDSLELAVALQEKLQQDSLSPLPVLIQVKLGNEDSKTGIAAEEVFDFCEQLHALPKLQIKGLMCIPPLYGSPDEWFAHIQNLSQEGKAQGISLDELSMGMSDDLEAAIAHGSTMIRVGTALFCP